MSSTKAESSHSVIPKKLGSTSQDTRIDAAHFRSGQDPQPASPSIAESTEQESPFAADELSQPELELESRRIERQAAQLAEHLRNRQKDLDHREAQLNAAIAQLESDLRSARMWLLEQEAAHDQQRQKIDAREKELLERLRRLAATDAALKRRLASNAEADHPLQQFQSESRELLQQASALKEERRQWEIQRQKELETAENRLAQAHAEIQKLHEQLAAGCRQLQAEIHSQRQRLVAQQRQGLAELAEKRQALQRLGGQVDQRHAALVRPRNELQQTHRQTLEICLATEELWAQLSTAVPPADLTRFLAQILRPPGRAVSAGQYPVARAAKRTGDSPR